VKNDPFSMGGLSFRFVPRPEDVLQAEADKDWNGGDDCANAFRCLVATKGREIVVGKWWDGDANKFGLLRGAEAVEVAWVVHPIWIGERQCVRTERIGL
jgi:hypothetical protein